MLDRALSQIGGPAPSRGAGVLVAVAVAVAWVGAIPAEAAAQQTPAFQHEIHTGLDCLECHKTPGSMPPSGAAFCRSCHHTERSSRTCVSCHTNVPDGTLRVDVMMHLPGSDELRTIAFPHTPHQKLGCKSCHGKGVSMAFEKTCDSCHEEHHLGEADCTLCHKRPPQWAHEPNTVHAGCGGSICHKAFPVNDDWWNKHVCVACHRFKEDLGAVG